MKSDITKFIKRRLQMIDDNRWDDFWTDVAEAGENCYPFEDLQDVSEVTELLYDCGADPLSGIDYVPDGFLCGSNRSVISIPDTIHQIHDQAFAYMQNLKELVLPASVIHVDSWAFRECSNLNIVTIMNPTCSIGMDAFLDCNNIRTIVYNGTRQDWEDYQSDVPFYNCHVKCVDGVIEL